MNFTKKQKRRKNKMYFEIWVAIIIAILIFIGSIVSSIGWMLEGQRLEDERKVSARLEEENKALRKEVARLSSKLNLARLYVEMEDKK